LVERCLDTIIAAKAYHEREMGRRGDGEKGRRGERQLVSGPELTPHNTVNYHHA
jgi:hypothetical protein